MTLPLDGLDFDVIAPADVPLAKLTVVNVGHSLSGQGVDQDHWQRVGLAPADDDSSTAPVVETIARLGVRPTGPAQFGATTRDDTATSLATHAVRSHLGSRWTNSAPPADSVAWMECVEQRAQRVAVGLDDARLWTRTTATVAGKDYVLWGHHTEQGFAAFADLGHAFISVHGTVPPSAFAFQRLSPAQVEAAFT
jgi:hypothetical protein